MTIHNETHYASGCRTDDCRAAHAAGARRRRRAKAYGTHIPKSVPNVGVARRVEALMLLGWSKRELSRRLGWHADRISVMLTDQAGVSPRNLARFAALYDELWDTSAPRNTKGQRIAFSRTVALAHRLGYFPPLAWDDETIDDLDAKPCTYTTRRPVHVDEIAVSEAIHGRRVALTSAEKTEAVRRMTGMGFSAREIGERMGTSGRTAQRKRMAA